MKRIIIVGTAMLLILAFASCSQQSDNRPVSSMASESGSYNFTSAPPQSEPQQQPHGTVEFKAPDEYEMGRLREYAISFAESFNVPFASTLELDSGEGEIGRFSFWQIYYQDNLQATIGTDGACIISKDRLTEYVALHFGIEDYEFPIEAFPPYDSSISGYRFYPVGSGPLVSIEVADEKQEDSNFTFIMQVFRLDFETMKPLNEQFITYHFQIIQSDNAMHLMAISAQ